MIEVLSMKMSKFYEVSKVLDRRTDTNGRVSELKCLVCTRVGEFKISKMSAD